MPRSTAATVATASTPPAARTVACCPCLIARNWDAGTVTLTVTAPDADRAAEALAELTGAGIAVAGFALGQPSLDEVFLALTGHPAEHDEQMEQAA